MRKLLIAGLAAATLGAGGVAMTQPAHAAVRCVSGPIGLLRSCRYAGPDYGPYYAPPPRYYAPAPGGYYAPPPAYYGYGPYWR